MIKNTKIKLFKIPLIFLLKEIKREMKIIKTGVSKMPKGGKK